MSDAAFANLGIIVGWSAAALAAFALLADWVRQRFPNRRRRRCPRCWYDMSHSPGLVCSECGHAAKRERRLFKARRRWRLAGVALLMWIGGYALSVTPDFKQRGWIAAVPTKALILSMPFLHPDFDAFGIPI